MEELIQKYISQIMDDAKLSDMPEDFKADYIEKLQTEIERRLGITALKSMDESAVKKFNELITEDPNLPPEKIAEFYQEHIPNFSEVMNKTLEDFKQEFIKKAQSLSSSNFS